MKQQAGISATTISADILIVGAGLVGAAVALGAEAQGYSVAVLEPSPLRDAAQAPVAEPLAQKVADFDLRVSAITRASQRLLTELGVWQKVAPFVQSYQQMDVWDAEGSGRIMFSAAEVYEDDLGCIVENNRMLSALHAALASRPGIVVIPACLEKLDISNAGVQVTTGELMINSALVIGADGANSALRRKLAMPTREWDYGQEAIVATIETELGHGNVARQRFMSTGPLALLPLPDVENLGRFTSIVWSLDHEACKGLYNLEKPAFMERLSQASEHRLGKVIDMGMKRKFPLTQRHAKSYIGKRALLIGDAAHSIHPLAGQGVNLGFRDVVVLLEELARARARGLSPAEQETLQRYQRRRQPENLAMMAAMEGFKRGFGSTQPGITWLRNLGLKAFNNVLPVKKTIIRQALGL